MQIVLVAATTQRAGQGLQGGAQGVFQATASIYLEMMNRRLTKLFVPLVGGGYGGLKAELSLTYMLAAFSEAHQSTKKSAEIKIILFREDESAPPTISEKNVRRVLSFASDQILST